MIRMKNGMGYYPVVDPDTCKIIDCDLWSNITNLTCWGGNSITKAGTGKCSGAVVPPSAQAPNAPTDGGGNQVVPDDAAPVPGSCGIMDFFNGSVSNGSCVWTSGGIATSLAIGAAVVLGGIILMNISK